MSVAVGEGSSIMASGEKDDNPMIHIWDSNSLQNMGIIKGFHKGGVSHMSFFLQNRFLITCGTNPNQPVLIYGMKDYRLLLSTYMEVHVLDIVKISQQDVP
jgi:hypothetical protein